MAGYHPCLLLVYVVIIVYPCITALHVALHAQAPPSSSQVVGSVITTHGLAQAFNKSIHISAHVFYPYSYLDFDRYPWDLVIIEGWFPSIRDFIWRCRNQSPQVIVLFYCLDPSYPPLYVTKSLDVDGYLTNSRQLATEALSSIAPTIYLPLAADPLIMRPQDTPKLYDMVYIGAGGEMLKSKPMLYEILLQASSAGSLAIFGSMWQDVPVLNQYWKGILPTFNISLAYSQAYIVIASTIQSQSDLGMINNRIFEAMACGCLILSDAFPSLRELTDLIYFIEDIQDIPNQIRFILDSYESTERISASRELILSKHTWDHRVAEIIDYYHELQSNQSQTALTRSNAIYILMITSDRLKGLTDYQFLTKYLHRSLKSVYRVDEMSERDWLQTPSEEKMFQYDIIMAIAVPFDSIYSSMMNYIEIYRKHSEGLSIYQTHQRHVLYLYGITANLIPSNGSIDRDLFHMNRYFDVILYRNYYDVEYLRYQGFLFNNLRMEHVFGSVIDRHEMISIDSHHATDIIICTVSYRYLCTIDNILAMIGHQGQLRDVSVMIVLVGGSRRDWKDLYDAISYDILHKIVFYSELLIDRYDSLIRRHSKRIYYLNGPMKPSHGDQSIDTAAIDMNYLVIASYIDPIASYHKEMKFWTYNEYLIGMIDYGCNKWDQNYLNEAVHRAFYRIIGFAKASSSVSLALVNNHPDDHPDTHRCMEAYINRPDIAVYRIDYHDFIPGRDGESCIAIADAIHSCMIARFEYLSITIKSKSPSHRVLLLHEDIMEIDVLAKAEESLMTMSYQLGSIGLYLRGNLAADVIYNHTQPKSIHYRLIADENHSEMEKPKGCSTYDVFPVTIFV